VNNVTVTDMDEILQKIDKDFYDLPLGTSVQIADNVYGIKGMKPTSQGLFPEEKIFGIGPGRTATLSLVKAMQILGYRAKHGLAEGTQDLVNYDYFADSPNELRYRKFFNFYENAKFILTLRDMDSWIESYKRRIKTDGEENFKNVQIDPCFYGPSERWRYWTWLRFNEEIFREAFPIYVVSTLKYFEDKPGKLLVMNICRGDGWEILCKFLDKPVPDVPFPWSHRTKEREEVDNR